MHALRLLTIANIKSFTRDRAPLIFVVLFGSIFSGGSDERTIGYADLDGTPVSQQLATAFESANGVKLETGTQDELLAKMRDGQVSAVIVVPKGFAQTVAAKGAPATVTVYTDPTQSAADGATKQLVGFVLS